MKFIFTKALFLGILLPLFCHNAIIAQQNGNEKQIEGTITDESDLPLVDTKTPGQKRPVRM